MTYTALLILALLLLGVYLAILAKFKVWRLKGMNVEPKPGPVSRAITELVAVAGGIYVSLTLLVSLLKLSLPAKAVLVGISFDPLALAALVVALLQPVVQSWWAGR